MEALTVILLVAVIILLAVDIMFVRRESTMKIQKAKEEWKAERLAEKKEREEALRKAAEKEAKTQKSIDEIVDASGGAAENSTTTERVAEKVAARDTVTVLKDALRTLGGKMDIGDDGETVYYDYQGGRFVFMTSATSLFVKLYYPNWYNVELSDIDTFSTLCKLINNENKNGSVSTFYVITEDGEQALFHSTMTFLLIDQIPNVAAYLDSRLQSFFNSIKNINDGLVKESKVQMENGE
ncbi:MAG: hypothetical protein II951_00875 [Bacteroidales bacterium]|nr:hypothetical protein [Bacteroidales bacterium]